MSSFSYGFIFQFDVDRRMIRMINVGVIGLGRQGMLHLMSCNKIEGAKVVAASDSSKKALKKAKSLGVEMLYADYHELLNHSSGMDAVVISLPNFLHMDCVKLALEAGLDVFIEKPLARNVEECNAIVKLVEKTGKKLQVGNVLRFERGIQEMKEKADAGYIGNLEVMTIEEIINGPFAHPRNPAPVADWWFDPEKAGGGVLLDLGCHLIDAFRFFVGEECTVEFSSLEHKFNLPVEDGAIALLRSLNSSVRGIINVGWYQKTIYPQFDFNMVLHGSSGYLSINDFRPKNLYSHAIKEGTKNILRRLVGKQIRPMSYTYYYEAFYDELVSFFDCINTDSAPRVTATDGLRTVELIESAYRYNHSKSI
jgi:myo-inositol 2-dehydrogenase/D-chiro-inositol 1-dehydrogenase